ncbi:hypothetical protein [Shewanella pneumatophori]|uniref:Peptidase MA-like domain-containing protein n=1 Tax=Shewanella pneumatophori TaxID=314092 RepID=A0A9X2CC48_9GAMM|nr:hypothetical protein [Shewanella pneumatophori]MCL1137613.1 hypothetical protein [Shewanella pneumatophori]
MLRIALTLAFVLAFALAFSTALTLTFSRAALADELTDELTNSVQAGTNNGFIWTEIASKKALVCELHQFSLCLAQLPDSARALLPLPASHYTQLLGKRGAMVLPLRHAQVAGVVLTDFKQLPSQQTINWGVGHFSLPLKRQAELTYWHELGHLYAIDALSQEGEVIKSQYQHEWLADLYLVWRIAVETQSTELAWQQYHRRNIAMMADSEFMSHWSVPVLAQVLALYSAEQLAGFSNFRQFYADVSVKLELQDQDTLSEFSSLIQRTFGAGTVQPLPGYMYWRKPKLGEYLKPTLIALMGQDAAKKWLAQQQMDGATGSDYF